MMMVHTNMSFFAVSRHRQVNAQGLFDCLESSLSQIGIAINAEHCKTLVGIGIQMVPPLILLLHGLKGLVENEIPWVGA